MRETKLGCVQTTDERNKVASRLQTTDRSIRAGWAEGGKQQKIAETKNRPEFTRSVALMITLQVNKDPPSGNCSNSW
jgi:hypothetical protein